MTTALGHLVMEGLGSIRHVELDLSTDVTVLIGANGSGKSNLVNALELVPHIWGDSFQECLCRHGSVDNLLFEDEQTRADRILITLMSGLDERDTRSGYRVTLRPDEVTGSGLAELHEWLFFQTRHGRHRPYERSLGFGSRNRVRGITGSEDSGKLPNSTKHVRPILGGCRVFHFGGVSGHAPVKEQSTVNDNLVLRSDAENITTYLHRTSREHPGHYERIVAAIQCVTSSFDDFVLRPDPSERIRLHWKQRGLGRTLLAREASDGTPCFIYPTALLLRPDLPTAVVLDGPDLGLHPAATDLLAGVAHAVGRSDHRVLLAAQSVPLVSHFDLGEIVVPDRIDGAIEASRPDETFLAVFLENYSMGSLWEMNPLGEHPAKAGLGTILNRCLMFAAWWQDLLS